MRQHLPSEMAHYARDCWDGLFRKKNHFFSLLTLCYSYNNHNSWNSDVVRLGRGGGSRWSLGVRFGGSHQRQLGAPRRVRDVEWKRLANGVYWCCMCVCGRCVLLINIVVVVCRCVKLKWNRILVLWAKRCANAHKPPWRVCFYNVYVVDNDC